MTGVFRAGVKRACEWSESLEDELDDEDEDGDDEEEDVDESEEADEEDDEEDDEDGEEVVGDEEDEKEEELEDAESSLDSEEMACRANVSELRTAGSWEDRFLCDAVSRRSVGRMVKTDPEDNFRRLAGWEVCLELSLGGCVRRRILVIKHQQSSMIPSGLERTLEGPCSAINECALSY